MAVFQVMVLWHVEQFAAAKGVPADWCAGLLVCCQVVKWHPELPQSVGAMVSVELLLMWQAAQVADFLAGAIWCEFVNGKPVVAWLKVEVQVVVLWHVEHCEVGKPAAT